MEKDLIEIADKLGYEEQPMQLIEEIDGTRTLGNFFDDFLFVIELIISISSLSNISL